ncbi:MAG: lytic transglycosylase domain-containing protein [Clostridia bacterium]|nr:lytic transglycosylase domain-containing protein [Clostridia bacterium]
MAVVMVESRFDENAVSKKRAKGLMQIKDETFIFVCQKYGLGFAADDIFNGRKTLQVGVLYLEYLYEKFADKTATFCAYNAGETNVFKWLENREYSDDGKTLIKIPFAETRKYLSEIEFYKKVFSLL